MPWTWEQVLALAPDASAASAARPLSSPGPWTDTGADDRAVWGRCRGSGKNPYTTVVDLTGPAYKCSCPSRKFPCKHALGLLLLWSYGHVAAATEPEWTKEWVDSRAERAARPERPKAPPDPAAAAKRAERRGSRVAGGVDELDTWLLDQVRNGVSGLERRAYATLEKVAARMVDAQATGLATRVRSLAGTVASGDGWPARLLEDLGLLRLTVHGHRRLDALPPDLAACVRREVGYPVAREDVLATPPVRDRWHVLAQRDVEEERFTARRVWLRGEATGRLALVLSFGAPGGLDATLVPGTAVDADVHHYPGAAPLRALVGERYGEPAPLPPPEGVSLDDAAAAYAEAVAADPWVNAWPVVVDVTPVPGDPWRVVDALGRAADLHPWGDVWRLLAVSGGHRVTLVGEWTPTGVRPLSVWDGRLVTL